MYFNLKKEKEVEQNLSVIKLYEKTIMSLRENDNILIFLKKIYRYSISRNLFQRINIYIYIILEQINNYIYEKSIF